MFWWETFAPADPIARSCAMRTRVRARSASLGRACSSAPPSSSSPSSHLIVTFPARHGPKLREFTYPDAFADCLEPLNVFVQDAVAQLLREKMGKT